MEEDVEIDLLLKNNEQVLLDAARFSMAEDCVDIEETSKNTAEACTSSENQTAHLEIVNEVSYNDLDNDKIKQELNNDNKLHQELNDTVFYYMSQEPKKHLVINLCNSDGEDSISEHSSIGRDEFISEIMDDDEFEFMQESLEQKQRQILNKTKGHKHNIQIIDKLSSAYALIVQKDALLIKLETKLKQDLSKNLEKQKQMRYTIHSESKSDNIKINEIRFKRRFFKKFGMPYFEDVNGFSPPPNEDFKKKIARGELIPGTIRRVRFWTKIDKERLLEAIRKSLVEENTDKFIKEIKTLNEDLESKTGDSEKVIKNIINCQKQIRIIKTNTYLDLVSKENPDREYDWLKISAIEFNGIHSAEDCRRFWNVYLKPSVNKTRWEASEDLNLMKIAKEQRLEDWDKIAKLLETNRTAYQCFVHYHTRIQHKSEFASGKWTTEEDKKLLSVINESRIGDYIPWTKVASHMGNRNQCQVYNRWSNCLDPNLVKGKFTKDEDLLIVSGIEVFGMSYKEMSSLLTNRSVSQIRDRYERHILKKTSKVGVWSLSEDEKLLSLVKKHGEQNWVAVSKGMKTRTRTQVRQRYTFIQYMIKSKPGWSIADVKRRQIRHRNKVSEKTQKHVEKVRKELEEIENIFQLSKLERDTFRIEKLKELKDTILMKKYELRRRKKVFSDSSEVNKLLIDYFKNCPSKCHSINSKTPKHRDCHAYLNEIILLANYFGHELQLPKSERAIVNNKRLNYNLKMFLREALSSKQARSSSNSDTKYFPTASLNQEDNIDCGIPENDNTILMNDWWHSPPVPVTTLNFNEFFKRTVFDYSYGMHKDIWTSKINRSTHPNISYFVSEPQNSEIEQRFYMPPNHITTVGFRSLLLSRARLRRDCYEEQFVTTPANTSVIIKPDTFVNHQLLDQFQESLITLFTWPKLLSLTSIKMAQVMRINTPIKVLQQQDPQSSTTIFVSLNNPLGEATSDNNKKAQKKRTRGRKSIRNKMTCHKHESVGLNKIIKSKRKMKIEHLVTIRKKKIDGTIGKNRTRGRPQIIKSKDLDQSTTAVKKKRGRPRKINVETLRQEVIKKNKEDTNENNARKLKTYSVVSNQKEITGVYIKKTKSDFIVNNKVCKMLEISKPLLVGSTEKTYDRSSQMYKRANDCDNFSEPVSKKVKYDSHETEEEAEEMVDQANTAHVEMCLEIPPEYSHETQVEEETEEMVDQANTAHVEMCLEIPPEYSHETQVEEETEEMIDQANTAHVEMCLDIFPEYIL